MGDDDDSDADDDDDDDSDNDNYDACDDELLIVALVNDGTIDNEDQDNVAMMMMTINIINIMLIIWIVSEDDDANWFKL